MALVAALGTFLGAGAALADIVTLTDFVRDVVTGHKDGAGLTPGDGLAIYVPQFIRTVFFEDDVDAVEEVSGTGADGLRVMSASFDHLLVVDGGDLRVVEPGDIGIHKSCGLDKIGASLRDMEASCLRLSALAAERDHPAPAAEVVE